jgi:hypothetical protein
LAALPLLGLLLVQGTEAPSLVRELALLLSPLFFLQGLAVCHGIVARREMSKAWLVALYSLLFIAMPHAEILMTLVGLADAFVDFRARVPSGAKSDQ